MRQKKKKLLNALLLATVTCSVAVHVHEHDNPFYHDRLEWVEHVSYVNCEGPQMHFMPCTGCTTLASYMKLCDLIDDAVRKEYTMMASTRTGNLVGVITITPIALHCCIHWLAGGSHHDIRLTAGMGKTSFYFAMHTGTFQPLRNVMHFHTSFQLHHWKWKGQLKIFNPSVYTWLDGRLCSS